MKKALNAAIILVLGTAMVAVQDGSINTIEIIMLVIAGLRGALAFPPKPEWGQVGVYLPLIITAVIGALTQVVTVLQDGRSLGAYEVISAIIVFVSALGSTYQTPDAAVSDALRGVVVDKT